MNAINKVIPTWVQDCHLFIKMKVRQECSEVMWAGSETYTEQATGWDERRGATESVYIMLCMLYEQSENISNGKNFWIVKMVQSSNHRDVGVLKFENGRRLMTRGDGPEQEDSRQTMPFSVHISGWFPFPDDSVRTHRNENNRFTPVLPTHASLTRSEDPDESWGNERDSFLLFLA